MIILKLRYVLLLLAVTVSCSGYQTDRVYQFTANHPLASIDSSNAQIAASSSIIGIYYPSNNSVVYSPKRDLLTGVYGRQVRRR